MKTFETNATADRRERRQALEKRGGACSRCPPHDGENRARRPRADRYKSARKGR